MKYELISAANREIIKYYGVSMDWDEYGLKPVSQRAVFVANVDGEIAYAWAREETKIEPNYDEVLEAASAATA